jgi:hypothetical protein
MLVLIFAVLVHQLYSQWLGDLSLMAWSTTHRPMTLIVALTVLQDLPD